MTSCKSATAVALLAMVAGAAQAATVFSDNFNADAVALNSVPAGWTVTTGTVDIIGPGLFNLLPGNGNYIDLDGSSGKAGLLTSPSLSLTGGVTYTANFDLAGSQRGSTETGTVTFGTATLNYNLASSAGFAGFSLMFTPASTGTYALTFQNGGGDNIGALLDNVLVDSGTTSPAPEPQTYALLLMGLSAIALQARRRRSAR